MLDTALRVMANEHRRRVLFALLDTDPRNDHWVRIPDDVVVEERDSDRLHIEMSHDHLPKLEEAAFIQWDRDTHRVKRGPRFEEIRPLLERLHDYVTDDQTHAQPTHREPERLVTEHLTNALAADGLPEKDYYIRSALQAHVIETGRPPCSSEVE